MNAMWWWRSHLRAVGRQRAGAGKAVVAGALLLLPKIGFACPVCFAAGNANVLQTYYLSAVLMSLLPLVIVAVLAGWLRRLFKNELK